MRITKLMVLGFFCMAVVYAAMQTMHLPDKIRMGEEQKAVWRQWEGKREALRYGEEGKRGACCFSLSVRQERYRAQYKGTCSTEHGSDRRPGAEKSSVFKRWRGWNTQSNNVFVQDVFKGTIVNGSGIEVKQLGGSWLYGDGTSISWRPVDETATVDGKSYVFFLIKEKDKEIYMPSLGVQSVFEMDFDTNTITPTDWIKEIRLS